MKLRHFIAFGALISLLSLSVTTSGCTVVGKVAGLAASNSTCTEDTNASSSAKGKREVTSDGGKTTYAANSKSKSRKTTVKRCR